MEEDKLICTCMEVYRETIVEAIKEKGLKTVDEVGEATEAGTVCGECQEDIEELLKEVNGNV
ncbi:MAG: (2Fe-2S)-binding protein [Bacteroidales bacterium]|jgi:NAD(P)H-nitrite reductase large subunit